MKCLHKVHGLKQHTMESVMYANTVHNGAGESVMVQTAKEQAVQLGDISAVRGTLPVKSRDPSLREKTAGKRKHNKEKLSMRRLRSLIFITVQFALFQRGTV